MNGTANTTARKRRRSSMVLRVAVIGPATGSPDTLSASRHETVPEVRSPEQG
jgi:hypothetical protein